MNETKTHTNSKIMRNESTNYTRKASCNFSFIINALHSAVFRNMRYGYLIFVVPFSNDVSGGATLLARTFYGISSKNRHHSYIGRWLQCGP